MIFWVILFMALMIWARFGPAGLERAATVGAIFLWGLGVRNFLDTFWNAKEAEKKKAEAANLLKLPRENKYKHGIFRPRPQEMRRRVVESRRM